LLPLPTWTDTVFNSPQPLTFTRVNIWLWWTNESGQPLANYKKEKLYVDNPKESYFETFGFLMMKQYFSAPEMEEISRQSDSVLNKERNRDPFKGKGQQATTIV